MFHTKILTHELTTFSDFPINSCPTQFSICAKASNICDQLTKYSRRSNVWWFCFVFFLFIDLLSHSSFFRKSEGKKTKQHNSFMCVSLLENFFLWFMVNTEPRIRIHLIWIISLFLAKKINKLMVNGAFDRALIHRKFMIVAIFSPFFFHRTDFSLMTQWLNDVALFIGGDMPNSALWSAQMWIHSQQRSELNRSRKKNCFGLRL